MTDTELISAPEKTRRGAGLSGMVLTELRSLAGELGIKSISGMRKGDLIAAISERQGGSGAGPAGATKAPSRRSAVDKTRTNDAAATTETTQPTEATQPSAATPSADAAPVADASA
ncbi:MAG: Rho termination factor N-terminal domain-containing protein, partial [Rhodococcus sp. (in: high G+C Gram-positive bacteria)]